MPRQQFLMDMAVATLVGGVVGAVVLYAMAKTVGS